MHSLSCAWTGAPRKTTFSAGKRIAIGALTVAGLAGIIFAERSVKASGPKNALPMTFSVAVVPVQQDSVITPEKLELGRLKARNRRLEALVWVLQRRAQNNR